MEILKDSNYPDNLVVDVEGLATKESWGAQATALVNGGDDSEQVHASALVLVVQSDMFM